MEQNTELVVSWSFRKLSLYRVYLQAVRLPKMGCFGECYQRSWQTSNGHLGIDSACHHFVVL